MNYDNVHDIIPIYIVEINMGEWLEMKKYLVSYEVKRKGLLPLQSNAIEYAENKKDIREHYKCCYKGYKIVKIEKINE